MRSATELLSSFDLLPRRGAALGACAAAVLLAGCSTAVVRYPNADPAATTSRAVEVGAGDALVFVSGQSAEPADTKAAQFSPAYWGDTEAQARTALAKVDGQLRRVGLGMGDVVKLQVYLVGDPALQGRMDSAGFARAWGAWFAGSAAHPLPARTVVQVAALGHPGMMVEIEATAARKAGPAPGSHLPPHVRG